MIIPMPLNFLLKQHPDIGSAKDDEKFRWNLKEFKKRPTHLRNTIGARLTGIFLYLYETRVVG